MMFAAIPADIDSLKGLISSLKSEENMVKFATHTRYDRWVQRKMVEALGDMNNTKVLHFEGAFSCLSLFSLQLYHFIKKVG